MFSTMTKPLVLLCVVHAISLVSVTAAPHRLQKRTLVDRKLADPLISGWVAAWKGQVAADIYHQYNELSFFSAVIDNTNLSVAWSVDGGPEKVFTDGYIEKNYETQPILLSIGGWTGSKSVSGY